MDANAKAQLVQRDFSGAAALAKGFFDHLIRHSESYSEKWEYVRQNPVRAGLVNESRRLALARRDHKARSVAAVLVSSTEPKSSHLDRRLPQTPLHLSARGVARFWFLSARGLEPENCFAVFHQIETIARNRFQIS